MFNFLIKKKIHAAFVRNTRSKAFRNIDAMAKVLILFSSKDWEQVKQIANDLRTRGKQVVLWTVQTQKQEKPLLADGVVPSYLRVVTYKELSWWNTLDSSVVSEFKKLSYDTLLDLTTDTDNASLLLLANNASEFCIGIKELDYKLYDFVLLKDDRQDLIETYNQIKIYLDNMR